MINNPGIMYDESHFARGVSDVTCIFASFEGFNQLSSPAQFGSTTRPALQPFPIRLLMPRPCAR